MSKADRREVLATSLDQGRLLGFEHAVLTSQDLSEQKVVLATALNKIGVTEMPPPKVAGPAQ